MPSSIYSSSGIDSYEIISPSFTTQSYSVLFNNDTIGISKQYSYGIDIVYKYNN